MAASRRNRDDLSVDNVHTPLWPDKAATIYVSSLED
ncbi:hypothetical protein ABIE37_000345 [Arthrobacter bambusae]|uniref:Uncharacterized protein n=1 Tax=Arthrobacter bambusae TaxID=1338426 RepID=A0ABV2P1F7_9MICC